MANVKRMLEQRQVESREPRRLFEAIRPGLQRQLAIDPTAFAARLDEYLGALGGPGGPR